MASETTKLMRARNEAWGGLKHLGSMLVRACIRFYWDDCFSRAAALAYATLFALVPIAALSMSVLHLIGIGQDHISTLLQSVLTQYLPPIENDQMRELQMQVHENLTRFVTNVYSLNALIFFSIIVTSLALVNTIESALNVIWRVTSSAGILTKIINFWAVLTLGSIIVALSYLGLSTWTSLERVPNLEPMFTSPAWQSLVTVLVPFFATWLFLTFLYMLPSAPVRIQDSALGAAFSAFLFEIAKRLFSYWFGISSTYSQFYGVVAAIPLFLFWLYVTWVLVLYGAQLTYFAGTLKVLSGRGKYATDLGEIGALLGLRILLCLGRNHMQGETPPSEGEIAIETGTDPQLVRTCLDLLADAQIITKADEHTHRRALIFSPDKLTMATVFLTFKAKSRKDRGQRVVDVEDREYLVRVICGTFSDLGSRKDVGEWTLADLVRHAA